MQLGLFLMISMNKIVIIIAILLLLVRCVQYSPYEVRLKEFEQNLTEKAIRRITSFPSTDTLCFVFAGDAQRFYDDAIDLVASINQQPNVLFTVFAGDISDFGLVMEYRAMHQIFSLLNMPFLSVVGNHDLIYNGAFIYQEMFGDYDFSFTYSGFRFVFVNTNSREFNFNGNVPDIELMQSNLEDTSMYKSAIVVCHVPPGNNDFDNTLQHDYENVLLETGKVRLHLNGHNHDFSDKYLTSETTNIHCVNSYSLDKRKYIVFKIWHTQSSSETNHSMKIISF